MTEYLNEKTGIEKGGRMRKGAAAILAILLMSAEIQTAGAFTPDPKALKDSKSETLSMTDQVYLRYDTIKISSRTSAKVLVNRFTNIVEYVFLNDYKRYVRPKFVMPDAQALYNKNNK